MPAVSYVYVKSPLAVVSFVLWPKKLYAKLYVAPVDPWVI